MSGLAGVIAFDGRPLAGLVEAMTAALAQRGPDAQGQWSDASATLGHALLRTTPESLDEAQPLANEDASVVLVMDGRIDNGDELRRALESARLRGRSDAELVLRAFERWGPDCVDHLQGDFAFVAWEPGPRRAFCARDRLGGKPFHYCRIGEAFAFASELHALLVLPWVERAPNREMLAEFLAWRFTSCAETIWRGIERLPAGHVMTVEGAGARTRRYWQPAFAAVAARSDAEYEERYRDLLVESVRRHARSHRPVAFEVSGGLDSTAVLCIALELQRQGRLPAPGIRAYTMTFRGDPLADEVRYVEALGRSLGVAIEQVPGSVMPPAWYSEQMRRYADFPGYPNASMSLGMRERAAADGARVMMGGEGSDTWLQGSRAYYEQEVRAGRWGEAAASFRADAADHGHRTALRGFARHGLFPLLPEPIQSALRAAKQGLAGKPAPEFFWLTDEMRQTLQRRVRAAASRTRAVRDTAQRALAARLEDAFDAQIFERIERDAARAGLELRHPFQDVALVEFLLSVPERLRQRGKVGKYLHVRAMRGLVPEPVLDRLDPADFTEVMRKQVLPRRDGLVRQVAPARRDWVNPGDVEALFGVMEGPEAWGWPIWVLWGLACCDELLPPA